MDVFQALGAAERRAFPGRYLAHLRARDGVPDFETHALSNREPFFEELAQRPIRWEGTPPVAQSVFDRFHTECLPRAADGLDRATLWALSVAKVNRAERFGVELGIRYNGFKAESADDPFAYVEIEEFYHTRILRDALEVLGIGMQMQLPGALSRAIIQGMVVLPRGFSNLLVLCAELAGVAVFQLLRDEARVLFSAQPKALARIEELFAQILVDEVGHVHYVQSQLDQVRLGLARRALPAVARGMLADLPELALLFGRPRLFRAIARADLDGVAAGLPEGLPPFQGGPIGSA